MTVDDEPQALAPTTGVSLGTLQSTSAAGLVAGATEIATTLAGVIKDRGLSNQIHGREHVRVEGWTTLAALLGILPVEVDNQPQDDGSYVATVELHRMADGEVISRATSECGMDEPTWAARPRYARRSMAATRATGKACRLAFSWVMSLAGYEATPFEEMPHDGPRIDTHGDYDRETGPRGPETFRFGKYKGEPIDICIQDVDARRYLREFYIGAVQDLIDDPKKAEWREKNMHHLAAIQEWRAKQTKAAMPTQPPPADDEELPFEDNEGTL